jgi:hypothetical protein
MSAERADADGYRSGKRLTAIGGASTGEVAALRSKSFRAVTGPPDGPNLSARSSAAKELIVAIAF